MTEPVLKPKVGDKVEAVNLVGDVSKELAEIKEDLDS